MPPALPLLTGDDVELQITAAGRVDWAAAVIVAAGATAVAFNTRRLGVQPRLLVSVVALGALAVIVAQGFTPPFGDLSPNARTLVAAIATGTLGTLLAVRRRTPSAIWTVPAILPLLTPLAEVPQGCSSKFPTPEACEL